MDKELLKKVITKLKESSQKRKFVQSIDLIVSFKNLDLNKPENQVDVFSAIPYGRGRKVKICGLVGPELLEEAKKELDKAISVDEFPNYQKDKKLIKKLAEEYDFFVAQATIMPKIAQTFGRAFGPRQKMPNPKAGCVVPPNANLRPLKEKLQKTVRIAVKQKPLFQCMVGKEDQNEDEVIDTILNIYNTLIHSLPNEEHNIKRSFLKLTMSGPIKIEDKEDE